MPSPRSDPQTTGRFGITQTSAASTDGTEHINEWLKSPEKHRQRPDSEQIIADEVRQEPERLEDESGIQPHHVARARIARADRVHVGVEDLVEGAATPADIAEGVVEESLA